MPESMLISEETGVPSRWHLFHGEDGTARGSLIFAAALNRRSPGDEESSDAAVRWRNMAHVGVQQNAEPENLLNGLTDELPAVQIAAVRSLYQFDSHRNTATAELARLIRHPQVSVRHAAVLAVDEPDGLATQLRQ